MIDLMRFQYVVGLLPLLVGWIIVWWTARDDINVIGPSVNVGVVSFISAFWWTKDWWHPPTITGTAVGVEDFFLGFFLGGIAAGAHEMVTDDGSRLKTRGDTMRKILSIIGFAVVFYGLGWSTVVSFFVAAGAFITMTYTTQPQLLREIPITMVVVLVASAVWFGFMSLLFPDFTETWYYTDKLLGIYILGGPIEDYIWSVTLVMIMGPAGEG